MTAEARRDAIKALLATQGAKRAGPPILLPPAPYFSLAGEEFGARMILTQGADGSDFCLRPDFTLPIAIAHIQSGAATPTAYGYLGPVFRQRTEGPSEFEQAGIELLAFPDADAALDRVIGFAREVLGLYGVASPRVRLGDIDLFETLLAACDMPEVWRPRVRARFGHPEALVRLLDRLAEPQPGGHDGLDEAAIAGRVHELMLAHGLSPTQGRSPEEIVARYREKLALEAAPVSRATLELLRAYLAISGPVEAAGSAVGALASAHAIDLAAALDQLGRRADHARALAGGEPHFDAAFSPRLDYYTGITFEVTGAGGSVLVSGGQYDRLLRRLGAAGDSPAVGCAVWIDRLDKEAGAR